MSHFIYTKENALPVNVCVALIRMFEKNKKWGSVGSIPIVKYVDERTNTLEGGQSRPKESMDLIDASFRVAINQNFSYQEDDVHLNVMYDTLKECLEEYRKQYYFLDQIRLWKMGDVYNLQKYEPGQGYNVWHCENDGSRNSASRILAWMIYLNNVPDGGTEFNYDFPTLEAKAGTCVIWPAGWTHHHRSIVSNTKSKYLATGWFHYVNEEDQNEL